MFYVNHARLKLTSSLLLKEEEFLPDLPITEYWLVFTQSSQWINKFLKPHFSHVYILTRDQYNWIALNPHHLMLRVEIAPLSAQEDLISKMTSENDTVLKICFKPRHTKKVFGVFGFYNCVTIAKYALGLPIYAVTPYILYKKLLNMPDGDKIRHRILSIDQIKGIKL
jgi:hypothetical protein